MKLIELIDKKYTIKYNLYVELLDLTRGILSPDDHTLITKTINKYFKEYENLLKEYWGKQ